MIQTKSTAVDMKQNRTEAAQTQKL